MKHYRTVLIILALLLSSVARAEAQTLKNYLETFDYAARREMKAGSKEAIQLLQTGKAQLIDIRFKEEFSAWRVMIAKNIPLNELPARTGELDKNKIIITACPHKDRAIIAMTYLKTQGFKVKYLKDGLIGLAENLRGDNALYFITDMKK